MANVGTLPERKVNVKVKVKVKLVEYNYITYVCISRALISPC